MNAVFNAEEVLEIAIHIEKLGAAFYRRAAEIVDDPAAKEVLEGLAVMEDGHEIGFENMRADPDILAQLIGDPDGEAATYLQAFAMGQIFPRDDDPAGELDKDVTLETIFSRAIYMELASIAFYSGIKDAMSQELGQSKVEAIISEERRHVTTLSVKLASLLS